MQLFFTGLVGIFVGFCMKQLINWLSIDDYRLKHNEFFIELVCLFIWLWAISNLPIQEAVVFSCIASVLTAIAFVDFYTMQVPLIFILIGVLTLIIANLLKIIYTTSALWGIFVGAVIPLIIMSTLWFFTKRQGMGFGDIQMGIILGAWLGPMRMAITLFSASVLSLLVWIGVSLVQGFDKDRAMPMAPFLSVAGTGVYIGSFYYPELFHLLIF